MKPLEEFQDLMKWEHYKYAGVALVRIINCAIGHINDRPALEIKMYKRNWTTALFLLILCIVRMIRKVFGDYDGERITSKKETGKCN